MHILLEAYAYSQDADADVWDFAVDLKEFRLIGINKSDLRWLAAKAYVDKRDELTSAQATAREFAEWTSARITEDSCFIVTREGVNYAHQLRCERIKSQMQKRIKKLTRRAKTWRRRKSQPDIA